MNRPAARLWVGALVLGAASQLHSGPVRLSTDSEHESLMQPVMKTAEVLPAPIVDLTAVEVPDRWVTELSMPARDLPSSGFSSAAAVQTTLAIPLPPAVLPALGTMGAFAFIALVRKYRR